jgi:hypothetical protein
MPLQAPSALARLSGVPSLKTTTVAGALKVRVVWQVVGLGHGGVVVAGSGEEARSFSALAGALVVISGVTETRDGVAEEIGW